MDERLSDVAEATGVRRRTLTNAAKKHAEHEYNRVRLHP